MAGAAAHSRRHGSTVTSGASRPTATAAVARSRLPETESCSFPRSATGGTDTAATGLAGEPLHRSHPCKGESPSRNCSEHGGGAVWTGEKDGVPRREAELLSCSRSGSGVSLPLPPYEQRSGGGGESRHFQGRQTWPACSDQSRAKLTFSWQLRTSSALLSREEPFSPLRLKSHCGTAASGCKQGCRFPLRRQGGSRHPSDLAEAGAKRQESPARRHAGTPRH